MPADRDDDKVRPMISPSAAAKLDNSTMSRLSLLKLVFLFLVYLILRRAEKARATALSLIETNCCRVACICFVFSPPPPYIHTRSSSGARPEEAGGPFARFHLVYMERRHLVMASAHAPHYQMIHGKLSGPAGRTSSWNVFHSTAAPYKLDRREFKIEKRCRLQSLSMFSAMRHSTLTNLPDLDPFPRLLFFKGWPYSSLFREKKCGRVVDVWMHRRVPYALCRLGFELLINY